MFRARIFVRTNVVRDTVFGYVPGVNGAKIKIQLLEIRRVEPYGNVKWDGRVVSVKTYRRRYYRNGRAFGGAATLLDTSDIRRARLYARKYRFARRLSLITVRLARGIDAIPFELLRR